jgi:flavin-dependent dehydrogenase/Fe-S-cluster containining protein
MFGQRILPFNESASMTQPWQILVVGGGPSGSAAAITMARGGLDVTLVEQSHYRQVRVGELLSPQGQPVIKRLLGDRHQDFFLTQIGVVGLWDSNEMKRFSSRDWWTVDRLPLDAALAQEAKSAGAELFLGGRVEGLQRVAGRWEYRIDGQNRTADWVINATGRASQLSRQLKGQVQRFDRQVALVAFLKGDCQAPPDMLLETSPYGWWYAAPIDKQRAVAVFLTDSEFDKGEPRAAWQSRFDESSVVKERFGNLEVDLNPVRVSAGFSLLVPFLGHGWVAVGDAASAFDPLTNLGLGRAAETGEKAALTLLAAVTTGDRPDFLTFAEEVGREFNVHFHQLLGEYRQVRRFPNSPFWSKRKQGGAEDSALRVRTRSSLGKELIFPPDQNFECSRCGKCCSSAWVADVDSAKRKELVNSPEAQAAIQELSVPVLRVLEDGRWATNVNADNTCVFLSKEKLCKLEGTETRPTSCQQFPFLLRETPEGIVVGVSFLCSSIQKNSGRPLHTYSEELRHLLAGKRATVLPHNVSVSWGKGLEWPDYSKLETYLLESDNTAERIQNLRWYIIQWLDQSVEEEIHLVGPVPRPELTELEEFMSGYMVIQLEEKDETVHQGQLDALLNGETLTLRRSQWSGCWGDIVTLLERSPMSWIEPEIERFLQALIRRQFLLLHLPIFHNLLLLSAVPKLLRFYSAVNASKRGHTEIEIEDYYKALDLIEVHLTAHGRLDKPVRSFFRWHLELARGQCTKDADLAGV